MSSSALPESIEAANIISDFQECCFCSMQSHVGGLVNIGEPLTVNVTTCI